MLVYLQQMSPEHVDDSVDTGLKWAVEHILEGEVQRSPPPITSPRRHQLQVLLYILQSSRLYRLLQVDFVITGKFSIVTFRSRQYFLHCLSFNTDNVFYLLFFCLANNVVFSVVYWQFFFFFFFLTTFFVVKMTSVMFLVYWQLIKLF